MIKTIVAIDSQRGMANEKGIPWDIPGDKKFFRESLQTGRVLMGYGTYLEVQVPFGKYDNFVATSKNQQLRKGFIAVNGVAEFLQNTREDVWDIGGAGLLHTTMDFLDELYITQLDGDFGCTKFFPEYKNHFELISETEPVVENNITYRYQVWRRHLKTS